MRPGPRPRVFGSLLTDSSGPFLLVVADVQPLWDRNFAQLGGGHKSSLPRSWGRRCGTGGSGDCPPLWFLTLSSGNQGAALGRRRGEGKASGQETGPTTPPTRKPWLFPVFCKSPYKISLEERVLTA